MWYKRRFVLVGSIASYTPPFSSRILNVDVVTVLVSSNHAISICFFFFLLCFILVVLEGLYCSRTKNDCFANICCCKMITN